MAPLHHPSQPLPDPHLTTLNPPYYVTLNPQPSRMHAGAEVDVPVGASEVWLVGNEQVAFLSKPDLHEVPAGSITKQAAIL
jgi:hypothetical protein